METPSPKWMVSFWLTSRCECTRAAVWRVGDGEPREIIKTLPGPFDSPEELLATYIELIDQAEWKGEQLRLPESALEQ